MSEKKHYHRGRRRTGRKKSGGKGRIVSNIILILAVLVSACPHSSFSASFRATMREEKSTTR